MNTKTRSNCTKPIEHQMDSYLKTCVKWKDYLEIKGAYFKTDQPFTISNNLPCYAQYYLPALKLAIEIEGNPLPAPSRDKLSDQLLLAEHGILTIRLTKPDIYDGISHRLPVVKILFERATLMLLNQDFLESDLNRHFLLDIEDIMAYAQSLAERVGVTTESFYRPWYSKGIDEMSLSGFSLLYNRAIPVYAMNKFLFSGDIQCIDTQSKVDQLPISVERKRKTERILQTQEELITAMFPELPASYIKQHQLF